MLAQAPGEGRKHAHPSQIHPPWRLKCVPSSQLRALHPLGSPQGKRLSPEPPPLPRVHRLAVFPEISCLALRSCVQLPRATVGSQVIGNRQGWGLSFPTPKYNPALVLLQLRYDPPIQTESPAFVHTGVTIFCALDKGFIDITVGQC
jgi:hypothetical protein